LPHRFRKIIGAPRAEPRRTKAPAIAATI